MLKRLLREPLLHFLMLGAAVFLLFKIAAAPSAPADGSIVVTSGKIEQLATGFVRTWQRPPTVEELNGLVEDYVREEVLYREALALGLDKDDTIIRRRLRQKIEFLTEDAAAAAQPTDQDLQAWLAGHPESFRIEPKMALRQVYVNVSRRGAGAMNRAEKLLARLNAGQISDASELGDRTMLPYQLAASSLDEIARVFGDNFAQQVAKIEPGRWSGPVRSGYGLHLVYVSARTEGKLRPLAEVRDTVRREWLTARRKEMADASYRALREKYSVVVEGPVAERSANTSESEDAAKLARGR